MANVSAAYSAERMPIFPAPDLEKQGIYPVFKWYCVPIVTGDATGGVATVSANLELSTELAFMYYTLESFRVSTDDTNVTYGVLYRHPSYWKDLVLVSSSTKDILQAVTFQDGGGATQAADKPLITRPLYLGTPEAGQNAQLSFQFDTNTAGKLYQMYCSGFAYNRMPMHLV